VFFSLILNPRLEFAYCAQNHQETIARMQKRVNIQMSAEYKLVVVRRHAWAFYKAIMI
jgi:hypothetical protein